MDIKKINSEDAYEIVRSFLPMVEKLNEENIDYCIVGGLGIMLHRLSRGEGSFRYTQDADMLVDKSTANYEFAKAYIDAYSDSDDSAKRIKEVVFESDEQLQLLKEGEHSDANIAIEGADKAEDGFFSPSFDICRLLSKKDLDCVTIETIYIDNIPIKVASLEDILEMKTNTINLYMADIRTTTRPQDFVDVETIKNMLSNKHDPSENKPKKIIQRALKAAASLKRGGHCDRPTTKQR